MYINVANTDLHTDSLSFGSFFLTIIIAMCEFQFISLQVVSSLFDLKKTAPDLGRTSFYLSSKGLFLQVLCNANQN